LIVFQVSEPKLDYFFKSCFEKILLFQPSNRPDLPLFAVLLSLFPIFLLKKQAKKIPLEIGAHSREFGTRSFNPKSTRIQPPLAMYPLNRTPLEIY